MEDERSSEEKIIRQVISSTYMIICRHIPNITYQRICRKALFEAGDILVEKLLPLSKK